MDEAHFKLVVLRWLLINIAEEEAIASEIQFSNGLNRADLVVSSLRRLCSFEIKTPKDDYRRLNRQLAAYRRSFLESYVVLSSSSLTAARDILPSYAGILTISDDSNVTLHRKASPRKRLAREDSIAWLRASEIRKLSSGTRSNGSPLETIPEFELTLIALASVYERIRPKYDAFKRERGSILNSDDVGMLSLPSRVR
ncbi:MAG: hypothetical protein A3E01_06695 [Gammaproteobacteria bacterium RIFCSPHIGHO2_12_FULL_63_22]|nr:MAG: hypothetical protein A3E01_06695 [Gammaproteobacteria bacterium RIFCSPHIGHO2_12_FULL_63_22]